MPLDEVFREVKNVPVLPTDAFTRGQAERADGRRTADVVAKAGRAKAPVSGDEILCDEE